MNDILTKWEKKYLKSLVEPFESDTIFKGMKIDQMYSLKELKLKGKGAIEWDINHINM